MQENIIKEENSDEISLSELIQKIKDWYNYLKTQWKQILLVGFIGGGIGFLIAFFTPTTYTAKVSFVLEEGKAVTGGLSAIAGQFGLDLGGGSTSSNMLAGDNIIGLLTSRRMVETALLSPYDSNKSLADKYFEVYSLKLKWEKKFETKINFPSQDTRVGYSRLQDSLLQILEDKILKNELSVERVDKKMSFIRVTTTMREELLNAMFVERLVKETVDFYIETKTRRQRSNVDRLQTRADSLSYILNRNTFYNATDQSKLIDINPAFGNEKVAAEISGRNKLMVGTVYGEIIKNLEIQKVTLSQETPTIQVVDAAYLPLKKNRPSKLMHLILGGFIADVIFISWILLSAGLRNNKRNAHSKQIESN